MKIEKRLLRAVNHWAVVELAFIGYLALSALRCTPATPPPNPASCDAACAVLSQHCNIPAMRCAAACERDQTLPPAARSLDPGAVVAAATDAGALSRLAGAPCD